MSIRPLQQILIGDPALAELVNRRLLENSLELHVKQALPAMLARHVGVSEAAPPDLTLSASSGAAAGLVKQRVPEILRLLDGRGWKFTSIRVRVQARTAGAKKPKRPKKQLDNAAAARLLALAATVSDDRLSSALRKLASHSGHRHEPLEGIEDQDPGE